MKRTNEWSSNRTLDGKSGRKPDYALLGVRNHNKMFIFAENIKERLGQTFEQTQACYSASCTICTGKI